MKKTIAIFIVALMLLLSMASIAFAAQPPGLLGYEGQPGNQGGPQHNPGGGGGQPPGLLGYEGQPGNQGGPQHNP